MGSWLHRILPVIWRDAPEANDNHEGFDPFGIDVFRAVPEIDFDPATGAIAEIEYLDSEGWAFYVRFGNKHWIFPLWPLTMRSVMSDGLDVATARLLSDPGMFHGRQVRNPFSPWSNLPRPTKALIRYDSFPEFA